MKLKNLGRIGSISRATINGCDALFWSFKGVVLQIDTGSPITVLRNIPSVRCKKLRSPKQSIDVRAFNGSTLTLDNVYYKGLSVWRDRNSTFLNNYPKKVIGVVGLDYISDIIRDRGNKFLKILGL